MVKVISISFLVLFVGLQFFRLEKNLSPTPPKTDLLALHPAPAEVKQMLLVACYDCHSDHTRYPWYAEIQPIAWWLKQHVDDGKRELNLSSFGDWSTKRKADRLDEMITRIADRTMPLPSYTLVHHDAKFTDAQIKQLNDWLEALRDKVAPDE